MKLPAVSLLRLSTSSIRSGADDDTINAVESCNQPQASQSPIEQTMFGFAFDKDLKATRVYSRVAYQRSGISLSSSAGKSRGWSFLSDVSLAEVSKVSVVSLPISAAELCEGMQGLSPSTSQPHDSYRTHLRSQVVSANMVNNPKAAELWPAEKVASCLRHSNLPRKLLEDFLTDDMSGFALIFLKRKHTESYTKDSSIQELLWSQVQRLQACINAELLQAEIADAAAERQGKSTMKGGLGVVPQISVESQFDVEASSASTTGLSTTHGAPITTGNERPSPLAKVSPAAALQSSDISTPMQNHAATTITIVGMNLMNGSKDPPRSLMKTSILAPVHQGRL